MNTVKFHRINDSDNNPKKTYGLIAQEVEVVMEQHNAKDFGGILYNEEADEYTLRTSDFIAPFAKAIQEQQNIIDSLKQDNTELRTVLDTLTARVTYLES